MDKKTRSPGERAFSFLSSLRLAIVLIIAITLVCIVGSLIPQHRSPEFYFHRYGVTPGKILRFLVLDDVYHSPLFISLIALFAVNIVLCNLKRIPGILKATLKPEVARSPHTLTEMPFHCTIPCRGPLEEVRKTVVSTLRSFGFKCRSMEGEGCVHLFGDHGRFGRLGSLVTHLSLLIIIIGGIVSALFTSRGYMIIGEGEPQQRYITVRGETVSAPFSLYLKKFDLEFYRGYDNRPKAFRSHVDVYKGGVKVLERVIEVNKPLSYEGYTIHQEDYGFILDSLSVLVSPSENASDEEKTLGSVTLREGEKKPIPGTDRSVRLAAFYPHLILDENNEPHNLSMKPYNPAAKFEIIHEEEVLYSTWDFLNHPSFHRFGREEGEYDLTIGRLFSRWYTVLGIVKDHGTWIVMLGFVVLMMGLMLSFYVHPRRVWVHLDEDRLVVAGSTVSNRRDFREFFGKMCQRLTKELGK